jgi:ATP-binding cassette subfamily F protein uup
MLFAKKISLHHGSRLLLNEISLSLLPGDRVALVGENGMGKSTLLNILAGNLAPDSGNVDLQSNVRIGVLAQEPHLDPNATAAEAVRSGLGPLFGAIKEHERLSRELAEETQLATRTAQIEKALAAVTERIEAGGGFDVEHRVRRVLSILHIKDESQLVSSMSGGEKRRVDLARVLLSSPDVYLLDEPTNHLDQNAIQFLVDTFRSSSAPLLFISHDRSFIDRLATRIVELHRGDCFTHTPPYENYLEGKLIRSDIEGRTLHRNERLVVRELAWLRAGTPARTTKQEARISRAHALIEDVKKDVQATRERQVKMRLADGQRLAKTILELKDAGYQIGSRWLFRHLNLIARVGQRYGIIGENGAGKSTLLLLLSGEKSPTEGQAIRGPHTDIVRFDQNRAQLNPNLSLKETLVSQGDTVFVGDERIHIASYLERYLFSPSDMNRKVATLSGGEQNRLLMALLFKKGANCILLDEPTNDLDMPTLAVLEETVQSLEGVAFIVSHDRQFLDRVCTSIIAFEDGALTVYEGDYTTYERLKAQHAAISSTKLQSQDRAIPKQAVIEPKKDKVKKKRSFNEEREYTAMLERIEKLEAEKELLSSELSDGELYRKDPQVAKDKTKRLSELEAEIETLYERWQTLDAI